MRRIPRVSALFGASLLISSTAWIPAQPSTSAGREGGNLPLLAIGKRWSIELPAAPRTSPAAPGASLLAIGKRWLIELPA